MPTTERQLRVLSLLARWCVVLMLATIALSAFMRLAQAGLGCEGWPACYGQALRALQAGAAAPAPALAPHGVAAARLGHRVVASLALVLVLAMVMITLRARPALQRERALSLALLGSALGLAVLGIVTPGARLPAVVVGNLLGGFAMLAISWRLAWPRPTEPASAPRGNGIVVLCLVGLVLQIALGALVSGGHAALACQGLADCARATQASGWDWGVLNPWREPLLSAAPPFNAGGALLQWLHRLLALLLLPGLAWVALACWRRGHGAAAAALLVLMLLQASLGPLLVAAGLPMAMVLAHNLVAALMLATLARLA
ncbi:MAG: COX15/CtaA family protein [Ideonella sp.]|nr:COX15/CtaA family protein [Ideonella sp.]